jgi:hypothetical protein
MRAGRLMEVSRLSWVGRNTCSACVVRAVIQLNGGIQWIPLLERETGRALVSRIRHGGAAFISVHGSSLC